MELFRQVADGGKTVVCITHSLANVEATCHLVVMLAEGGRLAFVGTPEEAKTYFGVPRLGDVYRKLADRTPEDWQTAFRANSLYARYIRSRFSEGADTEAERPAGYELDSRVRVNPLRQAWALTRRYVAIWRGNPQALLTMLGQSLLVAVLLGTVFGRNGDVDSRLERAQRTVNLLFLLAVGCFWFGCNNAAKEIVKERRIYTRERGFNLRIDSYLASKLLVLAPIALIQISMLLGIVRGWCALPGTLWWQWVALACIALAGTALGLMISACARTEEVALALVPIAVMPQIILAGVIAPLSGFAGILARAAVTVYWGQQALQGSLPEGELTILKLNEKTGGLPLAVVVLHAALFGSAALLALWRQDALKETS